MGYSGYNTGLLIKWYNVLVARLLEHGTFKCYIVLVGRGGTVVRTWDSQSIVTLSWWGVVAKWLEHGTLNQLLQCPEASPKMTICS